MYLILFISPIEAPVYPNMQLQAVATVMQESLT